MTRRRRAVQLVVVVATIAGAGALATGVSSSAASSSLDKAGWWWRAQTGAGPAALPAPPTVPDKGLEVASAPDGATAIAALRFTLPAGEGSPKLTLQVVDAEADPSVTPVLAACPAGSAWNTTYAGAWNTAPTAACAQLGSVLGIRAADGKSWTFAVAPLLHDGVIDVVITPGTIEGRPAGVAYPVFKYDFAAPTSASLTTTAGAPPATSTDPAASDAFAPAADSSTAFDTSTFSASSAASAPFTPSLPDSAQQLTLTAPSVVQSTAANALPASSSTRRDGIGLAVLVLIGGLALAYRVNGQAVPAPRRLGPLASRQSQHALVAPDAPQAGGLGRFARPRLGPPPAL